MNEPLDPNKTIIILKAMNGTEVGRIAAASSNVKEYIETLGSMYNGLTMEFIEDEDAAMLSTLFSSPPRSSHY